MIELSLNNVLFIYFLVWMLVIFALWIREGLRAKRNSWTLSSSKLFHCDNCHHTFLVKDNVNISRCPSCNSICINKKRNI